MIPVAASIALTAGAHMWQVLLRILPFVGLRQESSEGSARAIHGGFKASRTVKGIAITAAGLLALGVLVRVLMPRFMICLPVALRGNAQTGCWVTARKDLGILPAGPIYWYMDRFPDRTSAEAAASAEFLHPERGEAGGERVRCAPGLALVSLGLPTPPIP